MVLKLKKTETEDTRKAKSCHDSVYQGTILMPIFRVPARQKSCHDMLKIETQYEERQDCNLNFWDNRDTILMNQDMIYTVKN